MMIRGAKLTHNYKEMLTMMVCDMNSEECMFSQCDLCPGSEAVVAQCLEGLGPQDDDVFQISYKQWVTTDRCSLLMVVESYEDFKENLLEKLSVLKKHHYVASALSTFLRAKKEQLEADECLLLCDFSENVSFVMQDEIQSYHWVNKQATLHPFVAYFRDGSASLQHRSICIISDSMDHSTTAVYTFQKQVLEMLKQDIQLNVKKVLYFTDGAAGQYKNKKIFINLAHHKQDFNLDAEWHFFCHFARKGTMRWSRWQC